MRPDSSEDRPAFWRKVLESKMAAIRNEASHGNGTVDSEAVRQVKDLNSLREIEESLVPAVQPKRWPLALAFFCTLVIVSVLFFAHVWTTRIDLDATVSEITFTVDGQTSFSPPLALKRAQIAGVELDPQKVWACAVPSEASTFILQAVEASSLQSTVSVDKLDLPQGTVITVAHPGDSFRENVKLTFPKNARDLSIVFSAVGNAQLQNGKCKTTHFASPFDHLTFHPSEQTVDLSSEPLAEDPPMSIDIPASDISLYRVTTGSEPNVAYASRPSTVFSGSLFFDSVGSRERKLREGERIELTGFHGFVFMLHSQKDRLRVRFSGEVADVRSGESNSTLKPTLFDYLTANHGLSTLWASVFYCFGVLLTFLKFWRRTL